MPETLDAFTETTVDGARSRRWVLPVVDCAELRGHRIARLGMDDCLAPYARVRVAPSGSFVMACISGQGNILLDGQWHVIKAGTVCMAPPRVINAFHAVRGTRWNFAWVRYEEPLYVQPVVSASSPVRIEHGAVTLTRIISGLREEWDHARDPKIIHHWIELLHAHCRRLAQPWRGNERLTKLWQCVDSKLDHPWTVAALTREVHLSDEHLRRLCLKELGRSPMQHVTYMRMCRAQSLLETTADKLDVVALATGYGDTPAFTRAFKRWVGMNPTQYRRTNH